MEILYPKSTQVLHDEFVTSGYQKAGGYALLIDESGGDRDGEQSEFWFSETPFRKITTGEAEEFLKYA